MKNNLKLLALILLSVSIGILFTRCNRPSRQDASEAIEVPEDTVAKPVDLTEPDRKTQNSDEFPLDGKTIADFVINPYQIVMEAKGDLNNDQLEDVALVLQNKTDSTAERPALVLLKQKAGGYQLYAKSNKAIGPVYINGDFKQYDAEDIKIDSAKLIFSTFSIGPTGNRETQYQFINGQLVLTYMETYNMGAGGQTGATYDFIKGTIAVNEVNTMKEEMPSTLKTSKVKPQTRYFFAETDPTAL